MNAPSGSPTPPSPPTPEDLAAFMGWVTELAGGGSGGESGALGEVFEAGGAPVSVARAPGRLDVMGGIADYSGSLVLQMPIAQAACAAVQLTRRPGLRLVTAPPPPPEGAQSQATSFVGGEQADAARTVELEAEVLGVEETRARQRLAELGADAWAAYVVGPLLVMLKELGLDPPRGAAVVLRSAVPEGKGVSSSAAVQTATMIAAADAVGAEVAPARIAAWCQRAENRVAGAPCGIMDPMASACGRAHRLLALRCQPAQVLGHRAIPQGAAVWGVDSAQRHAVTGSDYAGVRAGAFMGYRIIADLAGLKATPRGRGRVTIDDPRWRGYLANITPSEFEHRFAHGLPETMQGSDFLARYAGIGDALTTIDPRRVYAVRQPTRHPVMENHRVALFEALLEAEAMDPRRLALLGELMFQSHVSYGACKLGSGGTDALVEAARQAGPGRGVYGAKITGGGSGGTVAVLGSADAGPTVRTIAREYARRRGVEATVFEGSSPGAGAVGARRVKV